jgi:hypothetical protein
MWSQKMPRGCAMQAMQSFIVLTVIFFGESPFLEDYQEDRSEQKPPWIAARYHTEPCSIDK